MEYIVENKQHLEKAETAYKNFTKSFKDQVESIKVHSFGTILLISLKTPLDNILKLPSNLWKITFNPDNWIEVVADDARITVKINDLSKLEIVIDKEFKL